MPGVNSKCFVPGCKSGYKSCTDKVSLFLPPSDPLLLSQWQRAIPRGDLVLTRKDRVCEKHFLPELIERTYVLNIGGQNVEIDRGKARLSSEAVPHLFSNLPAYLSKPPPSSKRKKRVLPVSTDVCGKRAKTVLETAQTASRHFDDAQYESHRVDGVRKLWPDAVPMVYELSSDMPKDEKKRRQNCIEHDDHNYCKQSRTGLSTAAEFSSTMPPVERSLASDASDAELQMSCGLREKVHDLEVISGRKRETVKEEEEYNEEMTRTGEKPFVCTQGSQQFTQSHYLRRHRRTHTGEKLFACTQCSKRFITLGNLNRHLRTHTGEKPFACTQCSKRFITLGNLNRHLRTHTGEKPFACTQCCRRFSDPNNVKKHMHTHTGEKPFACTQCSKRFSDSSTAKIHLWTHTGEKPFACTQCSKRFITLCNLKRHMRAHTGEKPFACTQCSMRFSDSSTAKIHLWTHTGEKPFACTQCSKRFTKSITLKRHLRTHTGEKPFACTQCSKRFTLSNNLKIHMFSHIGEKPFECTQCSMRFAKLSYLKRHLRAHTGEKPFVCTQCSKRYSDLFTLEKHLLIHTGEKPFPSKQRSNKFGVSGSVPTKLRTHFIEKPFACKQNSKKSGIRKAYVVHIQRNKKAENMQLPGVNCLDLRNQSELQFSEFQAVITESSSVDSEIKIFPVYCKEELNDDTDCKQTLLNDENGPICSTTLTDQVDTGISIENIGTIVKNEQLVGSTSSTTLSVKEELELPDELMECDFTSVVKQELTEICDLQYEDFKDGEDWKLLVDPFVELFPLKYPITSSVQLYG